MVLLLVGSAPATSLRFFGNGVNDIDRVGGEPHGGGSASPTYRGWIDEVGVSAVQRYAATTFIRPSSPFAPDGNTAALYHVDEVSGDVVGDVSGGGNHGARLYGGNPAGPEWSSDGAPLGTAPSVALEQVVSSLTRPVAIANAGDGRLFVVEADGRILVYQVTEEGPLTPLGTFLDIRDLVICCGERGLLGLTFHPNYATNPYFFVYYTANNGDGDVIIARYRAPTANSNSADPGSARVLLTIEHSTYGNHNGGGLAFGPGGYLYVAVGDGGGGGDPFNSGQSLGTLLGKVLRLDVDVAGDPAPHYEVPPDNPFVGTPGAREEIWAWGLRNPWRIAFDRLTGDLFIADVGQGNREEVNFQPAASPGGENYGWRRMEGTACYNPSSGCQTGSLVLPVLEYGHGDGCSVTGGYRYRGSDIPTLDGAYVFGDFCSGRIWVGWQSGSGPWSRVVLLETGVNISTFGEDSVGEVYVADLNGAVYRLVPARPRLTVTQSGAGTGIVSGPGIACGTICTADYDRDTPVTLTATADSNSSFAGWSGDCVGTGDCFLTLGDDRAVTATFDPRSLLQFSAPSYSVNEGKKSTRITVQRLVSTVGTATVDYTIAAGSATAPPAADADFSAPNGTLTGTLTFLPRKKSITLTIPIVKDARAEGPETILLSLSNPTGGAVLGAQPTAVITIIDDDAAGVLQFSRSTYSTSEANGSFAVPVNRSKGGAEATVTWSITGGSAVLGVDFTTPGGGASGTLTFGSKVQSQLIPLTLHRQADTLADGARTIQLALSNPQPAGFATLGALTTATLTITDDD